MLIDAIIYIVLEKVQGNRIVNSLLKQLLCINRVPIQPNSLTKFPCFYPLTIPCHVASFIFFLIFRLRQWRIARGLLLDFI